MARILTRRAVLRWTHGALPFVLVLAGSACSDDPDPKRPEADTTNTDVSDVAIDDTSPPDDTTDTADVGGEDAPDDVAIDVPEDTAGSGDDADTSGDATGPAPCTFQSDCGDGNICAAGACVPAPTCGLSSGWAQCVRKVGELDPAIADRAFCYERTCRISCQLDSDCQDGQQCTDNGFCRPFDPILTSPVGGDPKKPLEIGFGEALLDFPIGISLGGYGSRAANGDPGSPYANQLKASVGTLEGLFARAVVLDNGESQLLLIRLPVIFTSLTFHERLAQKLDTLTGKDWRDSLIISSTHTHSGPARHWHLPDDSPVPVGAFGTDTISQAAFDSLLESTFDAAAEALGAKEPGRLGWSIIEAYDTNDHIGGDRWGDTPPFDDNRVLLIRLDDEDGDIRAVLVSFAAHGTDNSTDYATNDVLGGVEEALENAYGEDVARRVPVLFFNQNSGTISPRGGVQGHSMPASFERMGWSFVQKVRATLETTATRSDVSFRSRTMRFPITYERVGYNDTDRRFAGGASLPIGGKYIYGALQCGGDGMSDENWETAPDINRVSCIGFRFLANNRAPTLFMRSQITALELEGLSIVTMPGELAMELSWQVLRELAQTHGVDPFKAFTWGYANDHHLYILPTNLRGDLPPFPGITTPKAPDEYPDRAFSWLQGGYEAGVSTWGPLFGDFLVARASDAWGRLLTDAPHDEEPLPTRYSPIDQPAVAIDETPPGRAGTLVEPIPSEIERLQTVEFAWVGGHPGAERPQVPEVTLERWDDIDASWSEVLLSNGLPYDNRRVRIPTRARKTTEGEWQWVARWEEAKDFPTGRYRFVIRGTALTGGQLVPYTADSGTFDLVPTDDIEVSGRFVSGELRGELAYPAAERFDVQPAPNDPGRLVGSIRMRHPRVPTGRPDPLISGEDIDTDGIQLVVTDGDGAVVDDLGNPLTVSTSEIGGRADPVPLTVWVVRPSALVSGTYAVDILVTDDHGNTGATSIEFTVP